MTAFSLHPRLAADCIDLGTMELSRLLLLNDSRYPWCILVPERADVREVYQLSDTDQMTLTRESARLSRFLAETFSADKMNTGALGNLVPQLHIHHIARYHDDDAWPGPVWGIGEATPYSEPEMVKMVRKIRAGLID
jgi:diadenosine tetraphosphate (Ap4A) HIT family hydrolase